MRLPDDMLKTVCFLCVKTTKNGQASFHYGGTGFFISIPSERYPDKVLHIYLVTARHNVVRAENMGCTLFARLNVKQGDAGDVGFVELTKPWHFPNNPAEDVAVVPWYQPIERSPSPSAEPRILDFKCFPKKVLAGNNIIEDVGIGIGDDVMIVGLFSQRYGTTMNHPIVRSGVLSAMPGEPLQDDDSGHPYHAYLAELHSLGGLSGSPVIVTIDPMRPGAMGVRKTPPPPHPVFYLLGLVRGHWELKRRQTILDYADDELKQVNMGIAKITPIHDVMRVILREDLKKMRRKADREAMEANFEQTPQKSS